jgi:uncharacterized membrane protein YeiH
VQLVLGMQLPSFPDVDLFAAGINALNGTLIASAPSHNRRYTFVGLLILGFIGGIGGGVSRDAMLNELPGPLAHVKYLVVCLAMGLLGIALYSYGEKQGRHFRKRSLAIVKSFTLPWFAVLGTARALDHDLGVFSAIIIGVIATTAGGVIIDLISGVTPAIVKRAEHLVTSAILASTIFALIAVGLQGRFGFFHGTWTAVLIAFVFRMIAVRTHWEEDVPTGHADTAGSINPAA